MAQDSRLNKFYSENVGLHDELNDCSDVSFDKHANPKGSEFDLGKDGSFSDFTVLIGGFVSGASMQNPKKALEIKGFSVIIELNEANFLKKLPNADVAWIISGTDPKPKPSSTSSGESYPAWNYVTKKKFQKEVNDFHCSGGGLLIWGDNDPLFEHANAVLPIIFENEDVVLIGNTPGGKVLDVGLPSTVGQFGRHIITSGIVKLYEGVTICYPKTLGKLKVLGTSSNGNPVICYADNEVLSEPRGRVVVDTGYTKNYTSWDDAGAARYIVNATIWLLGLEHRLRMGTDLSGRKSRKNKT